MNTEIFTDWTKHPVTKALMTLIQEEIDGRMLAYLKVEDAMNPVELAHRIGYVEACKRILNIDREELDEDESESN